MTGQREHILVIRHGSFGDLILCSGALADIRAHHAQAKLTFLTMPAFRSLMDRCPHVDEIITDRRRSLLHVREHFALRRVLRSAHFDRVYDLQGTDRTRLYRSLFLPDIPWSVLADAVPRSESIVLRYRGQLELAGVPVVHTTVPDVSWMAEDVSRLLAEAEIKKPYIVLIPGGSAHHSHRRWPYYSQLAEALIDEGYNVVTAPGPDELELAATIPGHTLTGEKEYLDWFQLAGVLKNASFVVGNDTGPTHLASCLGVPGLALYSPHTTPHKTGILRTHFQAIEADDMSRLLLQQVLSPVLAYLKEANGNFGVG